MKTNKIILLLAVVVALAVASLATALAADKTTLYVQEPFGLDMTNAQSKAFDGLLRSYEAKHPEIVIKYLSPPGSIHDNTTYTPWMQARMLAKDAPDILNLHQGLVTQFYGLHWFLPLEGMLDKKDPYAGGKSWRSTLDQGMMNFFTMNDRHCYGVPVDGVGVAVFYNKTMFKKAGIRTEPKTWPGFMTACQKLKKAGFVAWNGGCGNKPKMALHWLTTPLLGQMMQSESQLALRKKVDLNGDSSLISNEYAIAFRKGLWPNWEVYGDALKTYKQLTEFMPLGWQGDVTNFDTNFASGAVAMSIEGSWTVPSLIDMKLDFEFGIFQVPLLTNNQSSFASGMLCRHTGPWGYSLGLPGYLKDNPKRLALVEDLVFYLTSKASMQKVADASPSYLPFVKGVVAGGTQSKLMIVFSNPKAVPIADVPSWISLAYDGEAEDTSRQVTEDYLRGKITLEEAIDKEKKAMEASVQRQLALNPDFLKE